jgi:pimeloyl-ACP methyl ester carboxylesterase
MMWRAVLVVSLLLAAYPALKVTRGYRAERRVLYPTRVPVPLPSDASVLGLRARRIATPAGAVSGWFAPATTGGTIILCHGSNADRSSVLTEARALIAAGHGVWLFDWPGHGESEGTVDFGESGRAALRAVVDTVAAWPDVNPARLGLFTFSLGGVIGIPVAADDRRLKALVFVGSPVDLEAQTAYEYADAGRLAATGAIWFWRLNSTSLAGLNTAPPAARIGGRPVLVIAGGADRTVPPSDGTALAKAIGATATLWVVPGAAHGGYQAADATYATRVADFFSGALPVR